MTKKSRSKAIIFIAVFALGWAWQRHLDHAQIASSSPSPHNSMALGTSATPAFQPSALSRSDDDTPSSHESAHESAHESPGVPAAESSQDWSTKNSMDEKIKAEKLQRARELIEIGSVQEGAKLLEDFIVEDPANTQAMMELAMVYTLDMKDPSRAKGVLEKLIDVSPDHRAALAELSLIYNETGTISEGLETLHSKIQQNPQSRELQFAYGQLLAQKLPAQAIPWLKQGTEISDMKEEAYRELAMAAFGSGQIALAIESWTTSLRIQESELEQARLNGEPGQDYLEERIAYTKRELANAKSQLRQ